MGVTNSQTITIPLPITRYLETIVATARRLRRGGLAANPERRSAQWKSPGNTLIPPVKVTAETKNGDLGKVSIILDGEILSRALFGEDQNILKAWRKPFEPFQATTNRPPETNTPRAANDPNGAERSQQPGAKKASPNRVNRATWWKESWMFFITTSFISFAYSQHYLSSAYICWACALIIYIGMTIEFLQLSSRRFHDLDRSGAYAFIGLIPIAGWLILCVPLGFMKGTEGPNRYGKAPADEGGSAG